MNKSQRFWLSLALLALLVPALLASAAVPEREVVAVDYLQTSVEFEALTAAPGETVQREVRLPVRFHYADGTSEEGYETATFTLTNEVMPALSGFVYVCTGSVNQDTRFYTSQVKWQYDGTQATVLSAIPLVFYGTWPYTKHDHHANIASYVGWPAEVRKTALFMSLSPNYPIKKHIIDWLLPHNSPICTATGLII